MRFEAEFFWTTTQEEQIYCVTEVKPGTAQITEARPSVVIRRVEEGVSLCNIAKFCGASVTDICGANGLPAQEVAGGTLLLIPTRRN